MLLAALALPTADADEVIAPGVTFSQWTDGTPWRVSVLRVDLCTPGVHMRATPYGERGQRTSSWASSRGLAAAVNGGFFYYSGYESHGMAIGYGEQWGTDVIETGFIAFGPRRVAWWPFDYVVDREGWMEEAVSGSVPILSGGGPVNLDGYDTARHPRTVAGLNADHSVLWLVTVDGRSSASIGATYTELSGLLASLGATEALNLDGGGSTTMWTAAHGIMNVPSDGSERVVANHLGVEATGSGPAYHCPFGRGFEVLGVEGPEGVPTIRGEVGTEVDVTVRLRNSGTYAWGPATTLAPLPRDAASPYHTETWASETRVATVEGSVEPGAAYDFHVRLRIPDTVGTVSVPLTLVEENVAWFADSWGLPDGALGVALEALTGPALRAEPVRVEQAVILQPGETRTVEVQLRNTGTAPWPANGVWLVTAAPRERESRFATEAWDSPSRVAPVTTEVPRGGTVTFQVELRAPDAPGTWREPFTLRVADGRYLADDGGPADDAMALTILVPMPPTLGDTLCTCATGGPVGAGVFVVAGVGLGLLRRRRGDGRSRTPR
jgi:hypothetical protein